MTPMLFGRSESPLFGVLHAPRAGTTRDHGVLLCPSIGQEHIRAYGLLRSIAEQLSRAGFHALRFDWFGVGDSSGALADASLGRFREDFQAAAEELRDQTGVRVVSAFALRVGAAIALLGAARAKLKHLVLWDPVTDGGAFLRSQRALHHELIADPDRFWRPTPGLRTPDGELVGFQYGEALLAELRGLTSEQLTDVGGARVHLVHSSEERVGPFCARLVAAGVIATSASLPIGSTWDDAAAIERRIFAAPVAPALIEALTVPT